jgi:preprotein translocase subunit SecG
MIIVGVILLGVVITIAVVFSNMYNQISSSPQFASSKAVLPIQDKFMQFLPTIVVLMAIGIVIAIIWSRSKGGGGL